MEGVMVHPFFFIVWRGPGSLAGITVIEKVYSWFWFDIIYILQILSTGILTAPRWRRWEEQEKGAGFLNFGLIVSASSPVGLQAFRMRDNIWNCRSREASEWDMEEKQTLERHILYKQELKDRFYLQRTQMLARHQRVTSLAFWLYSFVLVISVEGIMMSA